MIERISVAFGQREPEPGVHHFNLGFGGSRLDYDVASVAQNLRPLNIVPSELGLDILTLGLGVYYADVTLRRKDVGDDSWSRHIDLTVPVHDPEVWNEVRQPLVDGLRFLSSDRWRIRFVPRPQSVAELGFRRRDGDRFETHRIALLSGGLDSAAYAVTALETPGNLLLASVSTANTRATGGPQNRVAGCLKAHHGERLSHVRLSLQLAGDEASQRARSFLFLSFAAFLASCYEHEVEVVIPENGFIALNVPLNATRMASNSTKTAHPYFLARVRDILRVLFPAISLLDPLRFQTKGEVLARCANRQLLEEIVPATVSCAKPPRDGTVDLHCGYCPACLIRRAAILAGYGAPDPTAYHVVPDLYRDVVSTNRKAEGVDIQSFKAAAERVVNQPEVAAIDVYRAGPLRDVIHDLDQYIGVYRRGMSEMHSLLERARTSGA